jgi:peptidoglycan/LPS O-acetylase OafA/YrhL
MKKISSNQKSKSPSVRLHFIDNLRVFLISLVVAHHAGQAYGPTGGEWPLFSPERSPLLGPFFGVNAAFFMGLLFLISGYFVPGAFDRKGAGVFLKDRLLRLGIPLLFIGLLTFGPLTYFMEYTEQGGQLSFVQYFIREYIGKWQVEIAHMWFVAHLLMYALGYSLWRLLVKRRIRASKSNLSVPTHHSILAYTLALAAVTGVVRFWYPIDRWEDLLFVIPAEIAHLPQYLSLFIIGIVAYRRDWLRRLPKKTGVTWLWIGLMAAAAAYAYSLVGRRFLPSITAGGGPTWRTLVYSIWEAFICVGLCVGLLVLFREKSNKSGKLLSTLSDSSYTVYIIHLFVVVGLQYGLVGSPLPPFIKFTLVTLVGVPLCFALSYLIKKLPFTRNIL